MPRSKSNPDIKYFCKTCKRELILAEDIINDGYCVRCFIKLPLGVRNRIRQGRRGLDA